jgi:hypothetical protein
MGSSRRWFVGSRLALTSPLTMSQALMRTRSPSTALSPGSSRYGRQLRDRHLSHRTSLTFASLTIHRPQDCPEH